ncbi:MAG: FHA domain-containing protein [Anaerolineae bacterium]|nr:FHA domain-containing protein [Anaerolineae bacterium]
MPLVNHRARALLLLCLFALALSPGLAAAQSTTPRTGAFIAYQCQFQPETNTATVNAVLMGADGQPIPTGTYQVSVTAGSSAQPLPSTAFQVARLDQRPPLQMILVLDITDTVPVDEVVAAISAHLIPGLLPEDRLALLTFSEEIFPITQFYTDKNRLVADHLTGLIPLGGDNRLYDSMLQAATAFPANNPARRVMLVITDSGRRELVQAADQDIITAARRGKVQIYPVGFYSRDRTDDAALQTIALSTGGFSWVYNEPRNSRASIAEAVAQFLDETIRTLNSEILLTVNMQGQTADVNGFVPLTINISTNNDSSLSDQINCPYRALQHSITFLDTIDTSRPVTGRVDIGVTVQSDMNNDSTRVVFRLNNVVARSSTSTVYTFNAAENYPGYYTIEAQLWDTNNATLATTPTTLRLYAQQTLALRVIGDPVSLSGSVQFEVTSNPIFILPAAQINVATTANPAALFPLGTAVFQPDGRAVLQVDNIETIIDRLFPARTAGDTFQFSAAVPGVAPDDPNLAYSAPLTLALTPPAQAETPAEVIPSPITSIPPLIAAVNEQWVPPAMIAGLVALNLLLSRLIRRRRITRMINVPDNHDLSPQLMSITLRRGDIKQSHTLTRKTVTIGRGSSNDINLGDDPNISRQHGVIMWRRQNWYYTNRKPQISTKINGKRYRGLILYKLESVTEIEIGSTLMIFHSNAQQDVSDFIKTNL